MKLWKGLQLIGMIQRQPKTPTGRPTTKNITGFFSPVNSCFVFESWPGVALFLRYPAPAHSVWLSRCFFRRDSDCVSSIPEPITILLARKERRDNRSLYPNAVLTNATQSLCFTELLALDLDE